MAPLYRGCHGHHSGEPWTLLPLIIIVHKGEKGNFIKARARFVPPTGSG